MHFTTYSENDKSGAYIALKNGAIDVLAGGRIEKTYDFASLLTLEPMSSQPSLQPSYLSSSDVLVGNNNNSQPLLQPSSQPSLQPSSLSSSDILAGHNTNLQPILQPSYQPSSIPTTDQLAAMHAAKNSSFTSHETSTEFFEGGMNGNLATSISLGGFHFSTPYYYGNETAGDDVSFFALTTRDEGVIFSSFVNCIVLATIYAQENGIRRGRSKEMPLLSLFGKDFEWALRDAIAYIGSYDQMLERNFRSALEENRGRNRLNENGGPQIHSFPGLFQ